MKFTVKILKFLTFFFRRLHRISQTHKTYRRLYAYYAFPALISLLITFVLVRWLAILFPSFNVMVNGVHVHHFSTGIFILLVVGYSALWARSWRFKYILALLYGAGTGFILDEFYVWLRLDDSPLSHAKYSAVVIGSALLLIIILFPSGIHALHRLFKKNNSKNNEI